MMPEEYSLQQGAKWDMWIGAFCGSCDKRGCQVCLTPPCLLFGENCARVHNEHYLFWSFTFFIPWMVLLGSLVGLLLAVPVYDTSADPSIPLLGVSSGLFVLAFFAIVALGTTSRERMKKKFGIASRSSWRPFLAWLFCGPCALCQETRTLRMYNVNEGVWSGGRPPTFSWKHRLSALLNHASDSSE